MVAMCSTSTSRSSGPRRVSALHQFDRLGAAVVDIDALAGAHIGERLSAGDDAGSVVAGHGRLPAQQVNAARQFGTRFEWRPSTPWRAIESRYGSVACAIATLRRRGPGPR